MRAIVYDNSGRIVSVVVGNLPTIEANAAGNLYLLTDEDASWHYIDNGVLVEMPPRPSLAHQFDYTTKQWAADIADLRAAKWRDFKQLREAVELSPFMWNGMTFDGDRVSQSRLQGAMHLANMNPLFEVEWTLADNSVVLLDKDDMNAVAFALGQRVASVHTYARSLRQAIDAATTKSEIEALEWAMDAPRHV